MCEKLAASACVSKSVGGSSRCVRCAASYDKCKAAACTGVLEAAEAECERREAAAMGGGGQWCDELAAMGGGSGVVSNYELLV